MANPLDLRSIRRNPHIVVASFCANILGLALPIAMIQVYDRIIPKEGYATLTVLALGLLTAAVADFGLRMARGKLIAMAGSKFETLAYRRAFRHMLQYNSPLGALDQGTLHDRVESIERVRKHHGSEAAAALLDIPFIVLFIAVLVLISPMLGLAVCLLAAASIAVVWVQRRHILKLSEERQERDQRRHSFLVETIDGIEMIKGLGIEPLMQRRYERLMSVSAEITRDLSRRISLTQGITSTIALMAPIVMSCVGSYLVIQEQMSIGGVAASVLLTGRIVQPLLRIEALLAGERGTASSEDHVVELLETAKTGSPNVQLESVEKIEIDRVSISPAPDAPAVLTDVSLTLRRGDCIALEGGDGSGRSLLLSALAGQLPPALGQIRMNSVPVGDLHPDVLSNKISLLSPDHTMLEGTLLENLTAFQVDKYRKRAFNLAHELGIADFIAQHPEGLAMPVASRASNSLPKSIHDGIILVSGLINAPDVILFDEANAGLDRHVDQRLVKFLDRAKARSIIVMVTHRPSYLKLANRTFSFDNHQIVATDRRFSQQVAV